LSFTQKGLRTAISYCRKSIKVKGLSVHESVHYQQSANQQYAELNRLEIVKEYSDVGYSGKDTNRPELQEMLNDLKSGAVVADVLIVYSVDRLGRDLKHNIQTMLEILNYVKQVVFVAERISSDSEHFKMFFLMLTGMAQDTRETLLRRLADGRKAKVLNRKSFDGNYPALGYVKDRQKELLVPATIDNTDDIQVAQGFQVLQAIYYAYLFGMSLRGIATMLNNRFGFTRRGKEWTYKSVHYILSNTTYCGVLKGTLEKNEHYLVENANIVPLVDPLAFEMIQKKLQFEKSGRKKRTLHRSPHLTLCSACANELVEDEDRLRCLVCENEIEKDVIENVFIADVTKLIKGVYANFNIDQEQKRLAEQYQLKRKKLIRRLNELKERRKDIEQLSEHISSKKKMLQANTEEIVKQQKELIITEHIIDFITNATDAKLRNIVGSGISYRLFSLPYLIIVDFQNQLIQVVFHREVFQSVGEMEA
jgi:DNA invertase Pin-like site-specific DNA recombinase